MSLRTLLAWSGGKDSALALACLRRTSDTLVAGLLTTVSPVHDRVSIHGVRRCILHEQAAALGLPLFEAPLNEDASNADYDEAWGEALGRARDTLGHIQHLAYGDLFLQDVRAFREQQATRLGYTPVFPLWGEPTGSLARQFIACGYEAYVSCVDTTQLAADFAGRRFDLTFLQDLPPAVDPCGERGEFHTCVVDGPGFAARIRVCTGARERRAGRFEFCDLLPVRQPPPAPA